MARGAGSGGGLMESGIVFKIGRLFKIPYGGEGVDFTDQLNYQFTSGLIVIFITIVSIRQYVDSVHQNDNTQDESLPLDSDDLCFARNESITSRNANIHLILSQSNGHKKIILKTRLRIAKGKTAKKSYEKRAKSTINIIMKKYCLYGNVITRPKVGAKKIKITS